MPEFGLATRSATGNTSDNMKVHYHIKSESAIFPDPELKLAGKVLKGLASFCMSNVHYMTHGVLAGVGTFLNVFSLGLSVKKLGKNPFGENLCLKLQIYPFLFTRIFAKHTRNFIQLV